MALQRPCLLVTKGTRTPPWPRPTSLLPLLGQHCRTQSAQPELAPAARITCSRSQPRWKLTAYTTLPQGLHTAALQLPAPPKPLQTLGDAKHPNSSKGAAVSAWRSGSRLPAGDTSVALSDNVEVFRLWWMFALPAVSSRNRPLPAGLMGAHPAREALSMARRFTAAVAGPRSLALRAGSTSSPRSPSPGLRHSP